MDQRERFEAEYCKKYGEQPLYRRDMKGSTRFSEYCNHFIQSQWETWQAAEAAALERAFEVIKLAIGTLALHGHEADAKKIAAKWRKLAAPVERGGE